MRKSQAYITIKGVDTYFIPPFWTDVKDIYLIPVAVAQVERKKPISTLAKYKVPYSILPPDPTNKANHIHRRLVLKNPPNEGYVIVADVDMKEGN